MGFKSDIQATRITAATSNVVIAPSIRLRGIIVASSGGGTGTVELKTASATTGTTLFVADVPAGDIINLNFPEDGIIFPQGIYVSTFTSIAAVTLLTDKYSGPGPMYQPQP
jgi:hypothetical protein